MRDHAVPRVAVLGSPFAAAARVTWDAPARPFRALAGVLRVFAAFALVTGGLDVATGAQLLLASGARLSLTAAADPILNSQIEYWGAIWAGFGVVLWWTTRDLRGRAPLLRILLGTVFLGGIGRLLAALRFGAGPRLLTGFIVIELAGSAAVWAWHRRLLRADEPGAPPTLEGPWS